MPLAAPKRVAATLGSAHSNATPGPRNAPPPVPFPSPCSYALIGLEQTAGSEKLPSFAFPRRCCLVLGREKEGLPTELLAIMDACVEIPQLGVVRSLNVHVSAALAMYEFTRQGSYAAG